MPNFIFTKLESEYLRTQLYGPKTGSRRKLEIVKPLLEEELGEAAKVRLTELDTALAEIRQFGESAKKLAADGHDECSLEYDILHDHVKEHSDVADAYMRYCFAVAVSAEKNAIAVFDHTAEVPASWPCTWRATPTIEKKDGRKIFIAPQTSGECMYRYCLFGLWDEGEARTLKMQQQLEE